MPNTLDLTIQVPASEWAFVQRRVTYLSAMLCRALREDGAPEWFSADELAALRLPGLPISASGITRQAARTNWRSRRTRDRDGRTRTRLHVADLPARAFDAMVGRLLDLDAAPAAPIEPDAILPPAPEPVAPIAAAENVAPPWVLPLVRLVRDGGDLSRVWEALPAALPVGVAMPSIEDAAAALVRLGLAR